MIEIFGLKSNSFCQIQHSALLPFNPFDHFDKLDGNYVGQRDGLLWRTLLMLKSGRLLKLP